MLRLLMEYKEEKRGCKKGEKKREEGILRLALNASKSEEVRVKSSYESDIDNDKPRGRRLIFGGGLQWGDRVWAPEMRRASLIVALNKL
ncbi:hypothetical protein CFAM422_005352 [Trichoderma lentiforme]|uniref:Uncharacterized protein n=1 Tax=Trichoderma lentiforme TaxID=1567552 RepID=A0A9P5CCG6_9HYPO|nr:hypothetical protein CFAM422_005352 [Trichoderma lentiforme]